MSGEADPTATATATATETDTQSLIGGADSGAPQGDDQSLIGGADAGADTVEGGEQAAENEGEQGGAEGKDETPEGAPEEYAEFELPEGIELDADANTEFTTLAKELDLSQGDAQKLVNIASSMMQKQADAIQSRITETVNGWRDQVNADSEIGGSNLKETLRFAALARDEFATPELVQLLNETNFGTNPEIVRLFARVGKAIGDDTFVQAGRATPQAKPFFDHPTSISAARA